MLVSSTQIHPSNPLATGARHVSVFDAGSGLPRPSLSGIERRRRAGERRLAGEGRDAPHAARDDAGAADRREDVPRARRADARVACARDLRGRRVVTVQHHEPRGEPDGGDAGEVPHVAVLVELLDHVEGVLAGERLERLALREEVLHRLDVGGLDERVEVLPALARANVSCWRS